MKIAGVLDHLEQQEKDVSVEQFASLPTFTSADIGKIIHVTTGADQGYHAGFGAPINAFVKLDGTDSVLLTGETCEVGTAENDLMFIHTSGEWRRGLVGGATVEEARVLGIAKNVSGTACDIATTGVVDGFTSRTIGSPQYLDKTTPGAIVETKPSVPGGGFVFMGVALTATKVVINIEHVGFT